MAHTKFAELHGDPVATWMPKPEEAGGGGGPEMMVAVERLETPAKPFVLKPLTDPRPHGSPPLRVRKDQKDMSDQEWAAFVRALEAIADDHAAAPTWHDLVRIHIDAMSNRGMNWGVHHMGMGMQGEGRNFLAWHRAYLLRMEERLRQVEPHVTIPYWNWVDEREIPPALSKPAMLKNLGVTRYPNSESLPRAREMEDLLNEKAKFLKFQDDLEEGPHNAVHRFVGGSTVNPQGRQVGGTMATSASPKDPVFWLHHAMVDDLWAHREEMNRDPDSSPPNRNEELEPPPLITGKVASQLSVFELGYTYA